MAFQINIDNGGTLTDVCIMSDDGVTKTKVLTTPYDLSKCFFEGLQKASEVVYGAADVKRLLEEVDLIRYSTTQGTNAICERKGPKLGLILAKGAEALPAQLAAHDPEVWTALVPASHGFDAAEILDLAESRGNLVVFAAPTMVKRLVAAARAAGRDGTGIRTIIYGGGPMYAADIDAALAVFGPRLVQIYGQGESPMTISVLPRALVADESHPRWRIRRASVGYAAGCVDLAILGPDGAVLGAGETGEICLRGPVVMRGYWGNPEASAETLRDGWLHTGDLGHLDAEGFLYLTDRSKDVIISGGTNIYPREVEEALLRHPDVFEVAVIGAPDPEWGEQVVAWVVFEPGTEPDTEALDRWLRSQIAAFKRPRRYVLVRELPKNSYGKILKTELRAALRPGAG